MSQIRQFTPKKNYNSDKLYPLFGKLIKIKLKNVLQEECKRDGLDISVLTPCKQKYEMTLNPKIKQHLSFKIMMLD